jgi:altronate dehydratase small subunit
MILNRYAIVMHVRDNVATAVKNIQIKEKIELIVDGDSKEIEIKDPMPLGHKFAIKSISKGQDIVKYGECIGKATQDIDVGKHVHVHNVESTRGRGDLLKKP